MSKVMYVTVGTSLFHSASWEPEEVRHDVPQYARWTANPEILKNPEARKLDIGGRMILKRLEEVLTPINAGTWAQRLAYELTGGNPDLNTVMRYSAELATILKLFSAEEETEKHASLQDFLRSYERIHLACDSSDKDSAKLPHAAAYHLAAYLNRLADNSGLAQPLLVPDLSSTQREKFLNEKTGLQRLAKLIGAEEVDRLDLVISGGFKLYGMYLYARLSASQRDARFHYIHEDGDRLLTIARLSGEDEHSSSSSGEWLFSFEP